MRLAIIVAQTSPNPAKNTKQSAKIGVESCQRKRYSVNFFIILLLHKKAPGKGGHRQGLCFDSSTKLDNIKP